MRLAACACLHCRTATVSSSAAQLCSRTGRSAASVHQRVVCHQPPEVQQQPVVAHEEGSGGDSGFVSPRMMCWHHTCWFCARYVSLLRPVAVTVCSTFKSSCAAVCYLSTATLPVMTVHRTPLFVDLRALCCFWPFVATCVLLSGCHWDCTLPDRCRAAC
jgi:hypothetical protein